MRLFTAFAILPFAAAALAFVGFPLFERGLLNHVGGSLSNDAAAAFAAGTFVVALAVTVLGAVPIVSTMRRRGPITFKHALIGGVALGNAPFLIVATAIMVVQAFVGAGSSAGSHWYGLNGAIRTITMSTLMGAALGSLFWLVGLRGRDAARG